MEDVVPSTRATGEPPMNCAQEERLGEPSGRSWRPYEICMPSSLPSPSSRSKAGPSSGVLMSSTSRMPAAINVESG